MPTFSIQSLVDRAAAISDMHDGFIKPADWLAWYNTERVALQIFMARFGSVMQDLQFDTVTASEDTIITGEFLAVVGVWELISNGAYRPVRIVDFPKAFLQAGNPGPTTGPAQIVSIEDNSDDPGTLIDGGTHFRFFPTDPTGTYVIVTCKTPALAVSLDNNQVTRLPSGLEERIVLGMARRALIKEESDVADVSRLIKDQDAFVEAYVWGRSLAMSPSVRNVDSVQRGWMREFNLPHPDHWLWI